MKWTTVPILLLLLATVCVVAGCAATRAGYESAPYRVTKSDGRFELRDYPALRVVETPTANQGDGSNNGFRRLFRFITGGNDSKQKIAMTTPVFMSTEPTNATMAFVMPAKMRLDDVPRPADDSVKIRELEPGRFAVLRFKGGRNSRNEAKALERLTSWLEAAQLKPAAAPVYAYFDPPWTPGFLRRNEVMLRVSSQAE